MGESLTESGTETTLPAPDGQRHAGHRRTAGTPAGRATIGAQRGSRPAPAEAHEAVMLLERARAEVDPVLRAALGSLPGPIRRIVRSRFGWEQADGTVTQGGSGRAIRPALVLAAAAARGGSEARAGAARAAAAVELVHHATLLHENVTDRGATRRRHPTAWASFADADADAVLAGDALQALALRLLAQDPHPAARAAAVRLAHCVVELCAGQHAHTTLERCARTEVTLDEVLAVAEAETGALIGSACAIGGLYAGAAEAEVAALDAFGREAGLAFRLIDDVIGIWGDPPRTGAPVGAAPAARRKSLPVAAAFASGHPAMAELAELYEGPDEMGDPERIALAVEHAGGRDWAQGQAADRMARAMRQLARAVPDPEAAGGLLALAEFATRRAG
ncbi:polyprenyl synthetase family protein [Streptomyces sp. NPDC101110]|uniref:polyprenyl synthetase family protein n=1 Tax=Streptomyces sp. NPDC101110 TaxID=3366104 RepID=UPI0038115820